MDEAFARKYKRALEVLPDVAGCAGGRLALVGGTALALFHLEHRVSVDLDFVPLEGDAVKHKEELKGCLTRKGYRASVGAFKNQFVVQFEDTAVKIEVLEKAALKKVDEFAFGGETVRVASIQDVLEMKRGAYAERREARDLFDVYCILRKKGGSLAELGRLIAEFGKPVNLGDVRGMAVRREDAEGFEKAVSHAVA